MGVKCPSQVSDTKYKGCCRETIEIDHSFGRKKDLLGIILPRSSVGLGAESRTNGRKGSRFDMTVSRVGI